MRPFCSGADRTVWNAPVGDLFRGDRGLGVGDSPKLIGPGLDFPGFVPGSTSDGRYSEIASSHHRSIAPRRTSHHPGKWEKGPAGGGSCMDNIKGAGRGWATGVTVARATQPMPTPNRTNRMYGTEGRHPARLAIETTENEEKEGKQRGRQRRPGESEQTQQQQQNKQKMK